MIARARCGQYEVASKTADELISSPPLDARVYFQAACGFSLCAGAVGRSPGYSRDEGPGCELHGERLQVTSPGPRGRLEEPGRR